MTAAITVAITAVLVLAAVALAAFLLPMVVARIVRDQLRSAAQGMAYHLMNGAQINSLFGEIAPGLARLLDRRRANDIAIAARAAHSWQTFSVTGLTDAATLARSPEIQQLFAKSSAEILAAIETAPLAAHQLSASGPARYYPLAPPAEPRLPAEHQPVRGALVHWPSGYLDRWPHHAQLVKAIAAGGEAHIVVRDALWARLTLAYLTTIGVPIPNLRFILAPTDDYWVRDSGPTIVATAAGAAAVVNAYLPNGLGYHKRDSEAAIEIARLYDVPAHRIPLIIEGGNLVPDGEGGLFMCDSVFERNPDVDELALRDIVGRWFGVDRLIMLPSLPGDITGHADIIVKVAEPGVLIVTQAPDGHRWSKALETAVERIASSRTATGDAWVIHRMPMPGGRHSEWTYVNALTVNDVIIAPSYNPESDRRASEVFAAACPGRRLHWVDFRAVQVGAVHCQTKELPALPGLFSGQA